MDETTVVAERISTECSDNGDGFLCAATVYGDTNRNGLKCGQISAEDVLSEPQPRSEQRVEQLGVGNVNNEIINETVNEVLMNNQNGDELSDSECGDNEDDEDCITDFLGKCSGNAEARLAARRQARAEAREIRMRELERQQREQEENADRVYDMYTEPTTKTLTPMTRRSTILNNSSYHSSRRSSEDSLEDGGSLRDVRHELKELEEKFRKAMIANAQLDNDKASYTYQIELLKDKLEDLEQDHYQLQREYKQKCREHEQLKRVAAKLKDDFAYCSAQLEERDRLIAEKGLVIVICDEENGDSEDQSTGGDGDSNFVKIPKRALVSMENAEVLNSVGQGSLDNRLRKFADERRELQDQVRSLRLELEEERSRSRRRRTSSSVAGGTPVHNGPDSQLLDDIDPVDVQREANKQLADYRFKLQKAEQDISTLQGAVARLESQVVRYKAAAEASERAEDDLKVERRKLQREARESQSRVEELETANSHLQKRLDKLKNAKSTLLKEL